MLCIFIVVIAKHLMQCNAHINVPQKPDVSYFIVTFQYIFLNNICMDDYIKLSCFSPVGGYQKKNLKFS